MVLRDRKFNASLFEVAVIRNGDGHLTKKLIKKTARVVQQVRTLISCIKNENSNFSSG